MRWKKRIVIEFGFLWYERKDRQRWKPLYIHRSAFRLVMIFIVLQSMNFMSVKNFWIIFTNHEEKTRLTIIWWININYLTIIGRFFFTAFAITINCWKALGRTKSEQRIRRSLEREREHERIDIQLVSWTRRNEQVKVNYKRQDARTVNWNKHQW